MNQIPCKTKGCEGTLTADDPHYIPVGDDTILRITDMRCPICNTTYVGDTYQTITEIKNRELCQKLYDIYKNA